jgi:hypothetical protein
MMIKRILTALVLGISIFSCSEDWNNRIERKLAIIDSKMQSIPDSFYYLIIPNSGCSGCISEAEMFVFKKMESVNPMKVIYTRMTSEKIVRAYVEDYSIRSRILFDSRNVFEYPDVKLEIYPLLIFMKNQKVNKLVYQRPGESIVSIFE